MLSNLVPQWKKDRARQLRKSQTRHERKLWAAVRRSGLGSNFNRQRVLRGYIADFYCPAARLVVEIDGDSHANRRAYDARRDEILGRLGILTLRFTNQQIDSDFPLVINKLKAVIAERKSRGIKSFTGEAFKNWIASTKAHISQTSQASKWRKI